MCFYGKDYVNLVNGGRRAIEQLKIGDRIWSMTDNTNELIQDEIIMMMHDGPNQPGLFYTFETEQGYHLSLTETHTLPVLDSDDDQIKFLRASKVTRKHRLLMFNQTIPIKTITYKSLIGYYAPITLSGYLFVNNISASCYSDR